MSCESYKSYFTLFIFCLVITTIILLNCVSLRCQHVFENNIAEAENSFILSDSIGVLIPSHNPLKKDNSIILGERLMSAVKHNDYELCKLLLENDAYANIIESSSSYSGGKVYEVKHGCLYYARRNNNKKIEQLLLEHGASPDVSNFKLFLLSVSIILIFFSPKIILFFNYWFTNSINIRAFYQNFYLEYTKFNIFFYSEYYPLLFIFSGIISMIFSVGLLFAILQNYGY